MVPGIRRLLLRALSARRRPPLISDSLSIKYEKRARISPINVSNVDDGVHDPTSMTDITDIDVSKNLFAQSCGLQPVEGLPGRQPIET